jgi:hypothetical protein
VERSPIGTSLAFSVHAPDLTVEIVPAIATTAAVVVALWNAQRALRLQRRSTQIEGRREAGVEIARWLQRAETGILSWHNPENWLVPKGMKFGRRTGIKAGDVVPPSQGRMGPVVTATVQEFDSIRGLARLAFGPEHEVSTLVNEVIAAIGQVARRGVISAGERPSPRDMTLVPLVSDLFEALAEACGLRDRDRLVGRNGVKASENLPT